MYSEKLVLELENKVREIRKSILKIIYQAQSGHLGGSLSATDIVTCLYYSHMKIDPLNPDRADRDRFVLSKGHAVPLLYAILADLGYFPKETLANFRQIGNILQGHPDMTKTPGIDMTSGSLGQGLSVGIGLALAANLDHKRYRSFVLLGDGETNEGQVWEAAMFAAKMRLGNLVGIVDYNGVQLDGSCDQIMPLAPFKEKWESFGWRTIEINGHNLLEILNALDRAEQITDGPVVIIADTKKGKGVSFMENDHNWHGQPPSKQQYQQALAELEGGRI